MELNKRDIIKCNLEGTNKKLYTLVTKKFYINGEYKYYGVCKFKIKNISYILSGEIIFNEKFIFKPNKFCKNYINYLNLVNNKLYTKNDIYLDNINLNNNNINKLYYYMDENNINIRKLANNINISHNHIVRLLKGQHKFSIKLCAIIENKIGLKLNPTLP